MKKHKLWIVALIALAVALFGWRACNAGAKNCSLGDKVIQGFALTAGFRWDQECPEVVCGVPASSTHNVDPAFIGAELRLPLASWATVGGNFDRDWTEAPDWNARVYVAFAPWHRPKRSR